MVDSVLLLVDAAEGPLPQTRYVLQKAMARHLPVVVAINKIDRGDARPAEVLDEIYELFMDLGADEHQIEFPIVYTNAKARHRDPRPRRARHGPAAAPRPARRGHAAGRPTTPGHPLQLLVTNLSANDYVGRMAVGRIWNGTIRTGQRITVVREEADDTAGAVEPGRTSRSAARSPASRPRTASTGSTSRRPARATSSRVAGPARGHDRRHAHRSRPTRGRCRGSTSTRRPCG